eukprot:6123061-Prorocentrum_lima.AAC.1
MANVLRGINALTVPNMVSPPQIERNLVPDPVRESAGVGKPPPPVLGKTTSTPAPVNLGAIGKAAP